MNDDVSEPGEYFFVYLHSPFGGARIDQEAGVAKITIEANDNPNGIVGFVEPGNYSFSVCVSFSMREIETLSLFKK